MADWTEIADDALLSGRPWTTALAFAALRNPVAIAEGASGAPKISTAAFGSNSVNENAMKVQQFSTEATAPGSGRVFVAIPGNLVFMPTISSVVTLGSEDDLHIELGGRNVGGDTGVYLVNANESPRTATVSWYRIVP